MSRAPDYMNSVSEALSEVMNDIGVNERLVRKRRRTWLLMETIKSLFPKYLEGMNVYHFGSQSEGSTTIGLESDVDTLYSFNHFNVFQDICEWKHGVINFKIIQNENISPGYCYLKAFRQDLRLPTLVDQLCKDIRMLYVADGVGRVLFKNTFGHHPMQDQGLQHLIHGPAFTYPGGPESLSSDVVYTFYCKSSPHQVTSWLQNMRMSKWPTEDVLKYCENAGCFMVPVGSKIHSPNTGIQETEESEPADSKVHSRNVLEHNPVAEIELEWRISTSLQERCLMFSLNITQFMCYILMKMILKTHINPYVKDVLTSFMCKNVLMYCIANSTHDWHKGNLLSYLHLCLFMLKECIKQRNCPHFIIPENNLLAGHMTERQRGKLLDIVNSMIENGVDFLFEIQIDDLGERLERKLNKPDNPEVLYAKLISGQLAYSIAKRQGSYMIRVLNVIIKEDTLKKAHKYLSQTISTLEMNGIKGDLQRCACELLKPSVMSMLGSVTASIDIDTHQAISDQALAYLEAGKESDALSGRLKLVSVLYCTGDLVRAECELPIIPRQHNVHTICNCYRRASPKQLSCNDIYMDLCDENSIKTSVAFCTRFLQCEIKCVPHELKYEILRSYIQGRRQKELEEGSWWENFIVVDSVRYLFFLQYKIYKHLKRTKEQQNALLMLYLTSNAKPNLGHKETALNLLGQCLEQEDMQPEAFQCYIRSLQHHERNNTARWLMCIQLLKQWRRDNTH